MKSKWDIGSVAESGGSPHTVLCRAGDGSGQTMHEAQDHRHSPGEGHGEATLTTRARTGRRT